MTETRAPDYTGFRFPPESTARAVWLYFRFALSYRDVEEVLAERGVIVTDETVCQWCRKVGQPYANTLRRRRPRPGDTWHLDEVFVTINGRLHYLWHAVDQDGTVLDILVQRRRDKVAAQKFLRKRLKGLQYVPRVVITDKLASYGATRRMPAQVGRTTLSRVGVGWPAAWWAWLMAERRRCNVLAFLRMCQNWDDQRFGRAIMTVRSALARRYAAASSVSTAAQRPWNRCRWAASETRS